MDRFSAHMDRAWELVIQGQTFEALVSARKALDVDEASPEVHNLIGYIHAMDGDFEAALSNYQYAMQLDDEYIDPILNTAELLSHPDSDPEEAIRLCRNVAQIVSGPEELVEAILLEVDALLNLGRIDEARTRLDDIEAPESLPATYAALLGRAFYEAGDPKESRRFIEQAIASDPLNADAWYYRGLIARDEGRRIDSVRAFAEVRKRDLSESKPPWAKHMEPVEPLVRRAIESLDEEVRAMLRGTEVAVCECPSERQILEEIDPRQVFLAEGVNLAEGTFEKLWVFDRNLFRAGVMPNTAERDIGRLLKRELFSEPD